jgi:xylitol oxidase
MGPQQNWAGNITYSYKTINFPRKIDEIKDLVNACSKLKVLGTKHSFNNIANTTGEAISLQQFNNVIKLDTEQQVVTVEAGILYGDLCQYLYHNGYALQNMASLPHICVAGAIATATHGSGNQNGSLATAVREIELVTGNGEVVHLSHEHPDFNAVIVGLGSFGVVTKLTLDIQPVFLMRQVVFERLPFEVLKENFEAITSCAYSVSLFTDWQGDSINQVWLKQRISDNEQHHENETFFGAALASTKQHMLTGHSAEHCTEQMGIPGPCHERLPHFLMDFIPSSGEELQSEYIVPYKDAYNALCAIKSLQSHISPHLQICEIRTIAADLHWMSPYYKQKSMGIHFTWKKDLEAVRKVLPLIEEALSVYHTRPHWGKLFTMSPETLRSRYEKLSDFKQLVNQYDPQRKLGNAFLETYIY